MQPPRRDYATGAGRWSSGLFGILTLIDWFTVMGNTRRQNSQALLTACRTQH